MSPVCRSVPIAEFRRIVVGTILILICCGMSKPSTQMMKVEECLVVLKPESGDLRSGLFPDRLKYLSVLREAIQTLDFPIYKVDIGYGHWQGMKFQFYEDCERRYEMAEAVLNFVEEATQEWAQGGFKFDVSHEPLTRSDRIVGTAALYTNIQTDDVFETDFGCKLEPEIEFRSDVGISDLGKINALMTLFGQKHLLPLEGIMVTRELPRQRRKMKIEFYLISSCDIGEALVSDIIHLSLSDTFPVEEILFSPEQAAP